MDLQPVLEQRAKVEEFTRKHRIGLLTLLFTDLVGSTKLKQELGDREAVGLIQRHHALVREILSRFNDGEEIGTAGDSFFIVFAKPSDAVQFSLLLQATLRILSSETHRPVLDRVGIHIGEVVIEERPGAPKPRDMYGLQVDICARVMSMAEGDQIVLTRSAFDNARQVLKGEAIEGVGALSWLNHGPYLLKGVEEPMEICEVGEIGAAVLKAPGDSEKVHRYVSADSEPVLGWRPAIGQGVPGTSWVLEEKLGEGGFGEVWLGRHKTTKERRVFKFCFRADRVRSLKREVMLFRVMKERLGEHPHIAGVLDVYLEEPPFYLTMEYVAGRDLKTWSEANGGVGAIPLETRLEIVAQVAEALQAAHDAGVIHRDVKPSNILIADRGLRIAESENPQSAIRDPRLEVKLTDFGIGQVVSEEALAGMTRLGFTETLLPTGRAGQAGTYLYMAPELLAGKPASKQSDIYSLGVVLYQLLVGDLSRPITTDWSEEVEDPLLRQDLTRCTAANPQNRFASAVELATSLRGWQKRRLEWELAEARKRAEEESQRAQLAEEHSRQLQAAYTQVAETLNQLEIQKAEEFFAANDSSNALAFLARVLRRDPHNGVAAQRIVSALTQRSFALPACDPFVHESTVNSFNLSLDGERLVTASSDKKVRIWSVQTGQLMLDPLDHDEDVREAQFSPDDKWLLTLSGNIVRMWHPQTGKLIRELASSKPVGFMACSPDGHQLLTGPFGTTFWDLNSGLPLPGLTELSSNPFVNKAHFSPDGRRIVAISTFGAEIWDARTGPEVWNETIDRPDAVISHDEANIDFGSMGLHSAASFSPDGQRLVTALADNTARVWNVANRQPLFEPLTHESFVVDAQFSPDGQRIATASMDGTARIWDAQSGRPLTEPLKHPQSAVAKVRFSPDGERIVTTTNDQIARVWNSRTGEPLTQSMTPIPPVPDRYFSLFGSAASGPIRLVAPAQFSRDGQKLVVVSSERTVQVWDIRVGHSFDLVIKKPPLASAQISSDGKRLVVASPMMSPPTAKHQAQIWDASSGLPTTKPLTHDCQLCSAEFSRDRRRIVTACLDGTARIWDADTGVPLGMPLIHPGVSAIWSARFSPDGARIATTGGNSAWVWDYLTDLPKAHLLGHDSRVTSAQFSRDGKCLLTQTDRASAGWEAFKGQPSPRAVQNPAAVSTTCLWDAATGQPLIEPIKHDESVNHVELSPDGKRLVTCSGRTVQMWSASTGEPVMAPIVHLGEVGEAHFSHDGAFLVTTSSNGTARVWNAETGQPLTEPIRPPDGIATAEFSPDGKRVITAGKTSRIWDVQMRIPMKADTCSNPYRTAFRD